ncbi:MAG: alpha/beta hydrolase, partial [Fimbriimonadaceae bacterium]|nr:alpha/beta hydrolase [Alphaproteobacteria bacterium]
DKMEEGFASLDEAADAIQNYLPNRKRKKNLDSLSKNLRLHDDDRYRWHWDPRFWQGTRTVDAVRDDLANSLIDASKSLTIPTLLVRGRQSELVSEEHVEEFLSLVPHAQYSDISEAGHMVAGDQNDIFADAVIDFLRKLDGAPVQAAE